MFIFNQAGKYAMPLSPLIAAYATRLSAATPHRAAGAAKITAILADRGVVTAFIKYAEHRVAERGARPPHAGLAP